MAAGFDREQTGVVDLPEMQSALAKPDRRAFSNTEPGLCRTKSLKRAFAFEGATGYLTATTGFCGPHFNQILVNKLLSPHLSKMLCRPAKSWDRNR